MIVALALLLTCGPSAVTTAPGASPTASPRTIPTGDLISLREGGQQPAIAVRKVATSELVRSLPDGLLLPDGVTLVALEPAGASTLVKKIDRRTGATIGSRTVEGTWQPRRGFPSLAGASADGTHLVLFGSSYNFTDQSGAWTARTTFGVLDLATFHLDTIQLDGRYTTEGLSNDGRFLYLGEYTPVQLPSASRLRVYDTKTRALLDVGGDQVPGLGDSYRRVYVGTYAFQLMSATETLHPSPDVIQVIPLTTIVRIDAASRTARTLRLPVERVLTGEDVLAWSLVASRDGKTLYVVNPAAALIHEIDPASLRIRRSAPLADTRSERGFLDAALAFVHPVAYGKMGYGTGAILSPDGTTLYVLGTTGIWSIDVGTLKARLLSREGRYETVAVSPDGLRLYALAREDGTVNAIDARDGTLIGVMPKVAWPAEIVAVDAG
ncbi:MAG TPA: hypothetical protein VFC31_01695 [Candidatus Limnocylindria bacterium]|nr:hypothetical protein [Candidatus Limnocylindria bacterium]